MTELRQYSYKKAKEDITVEISKMYILAQITVEQIKLNKITNDAQIEQYLSPINVKVPGYIQSLFKN